MKKTPYQGKTVIITGASMGIGREIALQLADQAACLALAARSTEKLETVASLCRQRGTRAIAVISDVSKESECKALVERTVSQFGRIDVLVNNAGIGMRARFEELPDLALLERLMSVNFWGSVYCTRHALPHLKATSGRIVTVISGGGKFPTPGACGYSASKHALAGFFDTLRIELQQTGVSVTAVYPEWVATGISGRAPRADGTPAADLYLHDKTGISPEVCARGILVAAANRDREVISTKLKLGMVLAQIVPHLTDDQAVRSYT